MSEKRLISIDWWRGIAALSVCFFHFTQGNPDYLSANSILKWLGSFGWMGVQVFFVISGYIIPYTLYKNKYQIKKFGSFLRRRLIRIEIPYIFSILLVLFSFYAVAFYRKENFGIDIGQVLSHLFYFTAFLGYDWLSPVYWTLAIEFQYYLLMGLIFPFLISSDFKKYALIIVLFISSLVFRQEYLIFYYLPLFLLGILSFQYQFGFINKIVFGIFILACLGYILLNFAWICMILTSFVIFSIIFWQYEGNNSPWLGKISYSLYLIHVPFGGRLIGFSELWLQGDWWRSLVILGILSVTLGFAYFFYKIIEQTAIQLSRKM